MVHGLNLPLLIVFILLGWEAYVYRTQPFLRVFINVFVTLVVFMKRKGWTRSPEMIPEREGGPGFVQNLSKLQITSYYI
jgi:hypothetical protein